MKNKVVTGVLCLLTAVGLFTVLGAKHTDAVTDTCTGVTTTFTGTAPSSVNPGQTFTLSNITSQPSNSYQVTVNSSTLYMSATNVSSTSYTQVDTFTNPSPTTGANTYIAYYPNWWLTATGAAGSQIVIKLVKVTADVQNIGSISCPLTATLATVNIVAPSGSGGGSTGGSSGGSTGGTSSGSTGGSTTGSTGTSSSPTSSNTSSTSPTPTATSTSKQTTSSGTPTVVTTHASGGVPVSISVIDKNKRAVSGANVILDGKDSGNTTDDGTVVFSQVGAGEHTVSVMRSGQKIEQTIMVDTKSPRNSFAVVFTPKPFLPAGLLYGLGGGAILLTLIMGTVIFIKRRSQIGNVPQFNTGPGIAASKVVMSNFDASQAPTITPTAATTLPSSTQVINSPQPMPTQSFTPTPQNLPASPVPSSGQSLVSFGTPSVIAPTQPQVVNGSSETTNRLV